MTQATTVYPESPVRTKETLFRIPSSFPDSPALNTRSKAHRFSNIEFEFDSDSPDQPEIIIKERGNLILTKNQNFW
jgi:hypothetical protein